MGYRHIDNLYKSQDMLLFRECYALEKIHGTSAHVDWRDGRLRFFAGGCKHDLFVSLFDEADLSAKFAALGHAGVTIYGEQYGGKQQGMTKRYGPVAKFIAFEAKVGDSWLAVPQAADLAASLGIEFVYYARIPTDLAALDAERDAPSAQAKRNGVEGDQPREGIVIRPLIELTKNNGARIMAKHKRADERETKTQREVTPEAFAVLTAADEIAAEWVTPTRLQHVLDAMAAAGQTASGPEDTGAVIRAMREDVMREGAGEFVPSKEALAAIGKATAVLFKARVMSALLAMHGSPK